MSLFSSEPTSAPNAIHSALQRVPTLAARLRTVAPPDLAPALEQWAAAATALARWANRVAEDLEVVHAAQREWRFFARALDELWFQNSAGDLACVPFRLAELLATGETLPFVITTTSTDVVYAQGADEYCRVPKPLHVVLKDLIIGRPWEHPGT